MEIIRGKHASFMDTSALAERLAGYECVHIDIGTGDGRFVQHLAQTCPNTFVIGLDACRENLHDVSRRAPANALFVIANALALPPELYGIAAQVTINFPWGSLLEGLLNDDPALLDGLAKIAGPDTGLEVRLNAGALAEAGWSLEAGADQVRRVLNASGFHIHPPVGLTAHQLKSCPTTWAKRLAFGRDPRAAYLCGMRGAECHQRFVQDWRKRCTQIHAIVVRNQETNAMSQHRFGSVPKKKDSQRTPQVTDARPQPLPTYTPLTRGGIYALQKTIGNQALINLIHRAEIREEAPMQKAVTNGDSESEGHGGSCGCPLCSGQLTKTVGNEEELEVAKTVGNEEELELAKQADTQHKASVRVVEGPAQTDLQTRTDLLAKNSVSAGAPASRPLGATTYGLTFPESVEANIGAKKVGSKWQATLTDLIGHYSMQVRLLAGQSEITGKAGATRANYMDQIAALAKLGNGPEKWYVLAAVTAHEEVHATRFLPALDKAEAAIKTSIEAITVPDATGMDEAKAVTALKADAGYIAALKTAQGTWLTEILTLVAGDHAAGGPTDKAEHTVVDPIKQEICDHAKANKWPDSPHC